jgi:putative DNA primase/helicase
MKYSDLNSPELREAVRQAKSGNGFRTDKFAIALKEEFQKPPPGLDVVCMADVQAKSIDWLWEHRFAIGKVSVLAGEGGQGKSTILCDMASRVTNAERWPDGADNKLTGNVFILTSEDDPEDTLKPRLVAAGADVSRIFIIRSVFNGDGSRRGFNLQSDLQRLEDEIKRRGGGRFVIIDPVTSYMGKGIDSHKNAEVRSVLEPLGEMAGRLKVAIICNNHFNKGGGSANSRIIGSVAFVNQARSSYIVTPDADDDGRMLFMPSKENIGPKRDGLAYRIEGCLIREGGEEIVTSRIAWESTPVKMSADAALAAHEGGDDARTAKQEAIDFLSDFLSKGERPAEDVQQAARKAGISPKSLRSARETLKVNSRREGFGPGSVCHWSQPEAPYLPSTPIDAHSKEEGKYGHEGQVWGENGSCAPALGPAGDSLNDFDGIDVAAFLRRNGGAA